MVKYFTEGSVLSVYVGLQLCNQVMWWSGVFLIFLGSPLN